MSDIHVALKDGNSVASAIFESSSSAGVILRGQINETNGRILVDSGSSGATATTWGGSGGNSSTISSATVTASSVIFFMCATPPKGFWGVVCGSGTFTITSSDSENSNLAFTYKVFS